jgi:hypothetical protein
MNPRNFSHSSNFFFGSTLFGEETLYRVQSCNLPGISFSHSMISKGAVQGWLQGDTIQYNDITLDIILDEGLKSWRDIVETAIRMRNPESSDGENIERTSWLEIHDDNSKVILKLVLNNSRIDNISDVIFSTITEDDILVMPITVKYDYFTVIFED